MSLIELFAFTKNICTSERDVTARKYAVIAGAVIIAIAALIVIIGSKAGSPFSNISGKLG